MTIDELKNVVQKFADRPLDVIIGGNSLMVEINQQIIEVQLITKGPLLYCVDGGREEIAEEWVIRRLGNLDVLANRILEYIHNDSIIVPIDADISGAIDSNGIDTQKTVNDVLKSFPEIINSLPTTSTNILYLTSDAGEGKTYVLNSFARFQAQAFLDRKSNWLLLPIGLAGRPFMRLDEVIVASLANTFRFRYFYYEALLELVKRKAIVLGLDGFEEMFIESKNGEVISSLGNLVSKLSSQGTMIFATRKAYYRNTKLESHAKLFKSIRDMNVSFGEVWLKRWNQGQFIDCCEQSGFNSKESQEIYNHFLSIMPDDHPVLTRAVLARRAIDELANADDRLAFAKTLGDRNTNPENVFAKFIDALIVREATEKWIDRTGEVAAPLLTPDDHCLILMNIAEEMWIGSTEVLSLEIIEDTTEVLVESLGKDASTIRQAKERIKQHALLQKSDIGDSYSFDHEEFRAFFIGYKLSQLVLNCNQSEIRSFLSIHNLPELAMRVAAQKILVNQESISKVIDCLYEVVGNGPRSSYLRINGANLLVRIISGSSLSKQKLVDLYFPTAAVSGYPIKGVRFEFCLFDSIPLNNSSLEDVDFSCCTITELINGASSVCNNVSIDSSSIPEVIRTGTEESAEVFYSPISKRSYLGRIGFNIIDNEQGIHQTDCKDDNEHIEIDERIIDIEKFVRTFRQSTQVNDNKLQTKLGTRWNEFEKNVLPELVRHHIVIEVDYKGNGHQRRFKLGVGFDDVYNARQKCQGIFDDFIHELKVKK